MSVLSAASLVSHLHLSCGIVPKHPFSRTMSIDIATALPHVTVLTPADGDAYSGQLKRWCDNAERKAKFVILPKSPEEVSQAVRPSPQRLSPFWL